MKKALVFTFVLVLGLGFAAFAMGGSIWATPILLAPAFEARAGPSHFTGLLHGLLSPVDVGLLLVANNLDPNDFDDFQALISLNLFENSEYLVHGSGKVFAEAMDFHQDIHGLLGLSEQTFCSVYLCGYFNYSRISPVLGEYNYVSKEFASAPVLVVRYNLEDADYAYTVMASAFSDYYNFKESAVLHGQSLEAIFAELEGNLGGQTWVRTYGSEVHLLFR